MLQLFVLQGLWGHSVHSLILYSTISLFISAALILIFTRAFSPQLRFFWHCFLRPFSTEDQKTRLDEFYRGQAEVYDSTRDVLLRGRDTMLSLSVAHLRHLREASPKKRFVWVDIGGGTGHNIEMMNKYCPIASFDAVYVVDLCEPLLNIARRRFKERGWSNVHVLCQDATEFFLPEWSNGTDPKGSLSFVTLSYSLSMIPNYYAALDRIEHLLSPHDGLLSVVDFYTAKKDPSLHQRAIGGISKECFWLSRWFWQIWFDFDHVHLDPARRSYLEYKFGTVKNYNGRNNFFLPFIVRIPYYIWLGRSRACDVTRFCHAFEVEGGNTIGNCSPVSLEFKNTKTVSPQVTNTSHYPEPRFPSDDRKSVINITAPLSSFHYQIKKPWRLPYYEQPIHKEFRTFIYSFTWEDPFEDMKALHLTQSDSMLVITSAGDNALHYAIGARPNRIHCVDMNPYQGHLLELKLAAIQSLDYDDFFSMFGRGRHPDFLTLLDAKIAPYLSSSAYQFWRTNVDAFSFSFYMHGYSGLALRLAKLIFKIARVTNDVKKMCDSDTLEEQATIWHERLRPVLLNPVVVALLKSPVFCWNALGVPLNQRQMILEEGTFYDYVMNTLDPLASTHLFKTGSYFYLLTLLGHYTDASCPLYLTPKGFESLKNDESALDAFRLHTNSLVNVLQGLSRWSLTRALVMDHLDWFSPGSADVDEEIQELYRVIAPGGLVFWRSAGKCPWYNKVFEEAGFKVSPVAIRGSSFAIDRVNMYASFWRAERV